MRFALLGVGSSVSGVALGLTVLALGGGLQAYILSSVASYGLMTLVAMWAAGFRLHRSDFDLPAWKQFARGGLPFLGTNLTLTIRGQSDRLLLAALASAPTVGWYAAALRVVSIPVFIPTLIMTPLLPALSRCAGDRRVFISTLHRSIEIILILMFPCSAMLIALAPVVPQVLHWGTVFEHSVPLIAILAGQMVLIGPNMAFGTALVALHRERRWMTVMVGAAILDVTLNLVLIPMADGQWQNGAIGAAAATLITEVAIMVAAVAILPPGMQLWRLLPTAARLLLVSGLQVIVVQLTLPLSLPLAIVAGGAVWAGGVLLLRVVRISDLVVVRRMLTEGLARKMSRAARPR